MSQDTKPAHDHLHLGQADQAHNHAHDHDACGCGHDHDHGHHHHHHFAPVTTLRREGPKVGRNDPCPCGSGKKYKKCCAA